MPTCNAGKIEYHFAKEDSSAQSVVPHETINNDAFEDLKSYLTTHFAPSSYGIQNCEEMYHDYEEALRSASKLAVSSTANFILAVNQLAKTYWNKQVGPEKIKQKMAVLTKKNLKHIYFNGFEKVSQF